MNTQPETIDVIEVLTLTRISTLTLKKWIDAGRFPPALNPTSKRRLWSREQVQAWARGEYRPASVTTSVGT